MDGMIEALELNGKYEFGDVLLWGAIGSIKVGEPELDAYTEAKCTHWDRQLDAVKSGDNDFARCLKTDRNADFEKAVMEFGIDMDAID